jgi:hypothetical protein
MTAEQETQMKDCLRVKAAYPHCFLRTDKRYSGAEEYTVYDPLTAQFVGPTAFTAANAWKYAAQRLERA